MSKSVFLSAIGLLGISSAAYFFYQSNEGSKQPQQSAAGLSATYQEEIMDVETEQTVSTFSTPAPINSKSQPVKAPAAVTHAMPLATRQELVSEWSDLSEFSDDQIQQANGSGDLWSLSNNDTVAIDDLPLDETELNDGRAFFAANQAKVAMMLPGDSVKITLPDTHETFALDVKTVAAPNKGLVSIKGLVEGQGDATFNMTRGAGYVVGHINTPTNSYSFEMHGNAGWIHDNGSLFTGEHPPIVDPDHEHEGSEVHDDGILVVARGSDQEPGSSNKIDVNAE